MNNCQHDKMKPRFYQRDAKNTYDVIHTCIANLREYYYNADDYLYNFQLNNRKKMRSERREAISALAQVLVSHVNLVDLEIVRWKKTHGERLTIKIIAEKAMLHEKRAKRAMHDLINAGYLLTNRKFKRSKDGSLIAEASTKHLSYLFFQHLHVDIEQLNKCIQQANKRVKYATRAISIHEFGIVHQKTMKETIKWLKDRIRRDKER